MLAEQQNVAPLTITLPHRMQYCVSFGSSMSFGDMSNRTAYVSVQDNHQMLKGIVSFIILIKLPRHVSADNCHLQGVTRCLQATPIWSAPRVHVGFGSLGVASRRGDWSHQANHNLHPPEAQTKLE
jgi:hypothetical protein